MGEINKEWAVAGVSASKATTQIYPGPGLQLQNSLPQATRDQETSEVSYLCQGEK